MISVSVDGGVAVVTLDRPDKWNAFNKHMGRELGQAYRKLDEDDSVRVIVLTGAPPAFCAGADLGDGAGTFDSPDGEQFSSSPVDPPAFELRKPVIAAVNGHAIGIGLTIAMQADIRIFAADAKYAIPQVRLGVLPDAMAHWTVPRVAGMAVAADILLTGRTFDGAEAIALGLGSRCLPADEVLSAALVIARDIATNTAPMSVAHSRSDCSGRARAAAVDQRRWRPSKRTCIYASWGSRTRWKVFVHSWNGARLCGFRACPPSGRKSRRNDSGALRKITRGRLRV